MRVGIVCPYSLDVAGGVQSHVLDLAQALIDLGHDVDVLAPADEATQPICAHMDGKLFRTDVDPGDDQLEDPPLLRRK